MINGIKFLFVLSLIFPMTAQAITLKQYEDQVAKYTAELNEKKNQIAKNTEEVSKIKDRDVYKRQIFIFKFSPHCHFVFIIKSTSSKSNTKSSST